MKSSIFTLAFLVHLILTFDCPENEKMWEKRSSRYNCIKLQSYHCVNTYDAPMELCASVESIRKKFCVVGYTNGSFTLEKCEDEGCPPNKYLSNQLYKFPICFKPHIKSTSIARFTADVTTLLSSERSISKTTFGNSCYVWITDKMKSPMKMQMFEILYPCALGIIIFLILALASYGAIKYVRRNWIRSGESIEHRNDNNIAIDNPLQIYDEPFEVMQPSHERIIPTSQQRDRIYEEFESVYNHLNREKVTYQITQSDYNF